MSTNGVAAAFADGELGFVDETALAAWIAGRRWYATKGRGIGQASVVQALPLGGEPPLVLAFVELRFHSGTWDLYDVLRWTASGGRRPRRRRRSARSTAGSSTGRSAIRRTAGGWRGC